MATLYRKYRPQKFSEIFGQNHIKITLEHEVALSKIAHAYLFCGPRAVGKTTVARILAKAINCLKRKEKEFEPCDKCEMCKEITAGRSLDVFEIDAASHTGVDNVRENIIANARIAPSICKFKVFIIDEVHMLSISAFNALLKVIEEPPEYVVFILCTTEVHKIPTTIISRCQRFDFKRINVSEIVKKLQFIAKHENIKVDKGILSAIARQSEGHMRDAESLLGQVVAIGGQEITREEADLVIPRSDLQEAINLIGHLAEKNTASAISLINKIIDEGVNLNRFLTDLIELLRKMLLAKINPVLAEKLGLELGEDLEMRISQVSKNLSLNQIIVFLERFIKAKNDIKGSFIAQLPVEIAITELSDTGKAAQYKPVNSPSANSSRPLNQQAPANSDAKSTSSNIRILDKDEIISRWNEILAKVKKYNHSLSFILRVCRPIDINGNQLCLAFKYKFHKERVGDANIKKLVEKVLHEVYGVPLTIETVIDENLNVSSEELVSDNSKGENNKSEKPDAKEDGSKMIDNLLETFGGKIIK